MGEVMQVGAWVCVLVILAFIAGIWLGDAMSKSKSRGVR